MRRRKLFRAYDLGNDKQLNRLEFVALCSEVLWHVPQELIETAVANVIVARASGRTRNRVYWKGKADSCDRWARAVIPTAYVLCLILLFNLDLTDHYADGDDDSGAGSGGALVSQPPPPPPPQRIRGLGPFALRPEGIIGVVVYGTAMLVAVLAGIQLHKQAQREGEREQERLEKASRTSVQTRIARMGTRLPSFAAAAGGGDSDGGAPDARVHPLPDEQKDAHTEH